MKSFMKNAISTTFFLAVLCAGLLMGCKEGTDECIVTFDFDGGNIDGRTTTPKVAVKSGGSVGSNMPLDPTKNGYTFSGWYPEKGGRGGRFFNTTRVNEDMIIYAYWQQATRITITYDANGGTGSVSPQTIGSGDNVTLAGSRTLTKAGYTFSGWNTNASGAGTLYSAGASANFTSSITLYAVWTAAGTQITITYDVNGGTGSISPQTIGSGDNVTLAGSETLTRADYTFSGWSTDAVGAGTLYSAGTPYRFTSDTTLYAKWSAAGTVTRITITYEVNGGTGSISPQTIDSGTSIMLAGSGTLTRAGYTFSGWNTDAFGIGTLYSAETPYRFTSDTTLYAKWSAAGTVTQVTITYDANGGAGTVSPQTIDSGTSVVLASGGTLTRAGYTFNCWNTNASGTGTSYSAETSYSFTSSITLYAVWTAAGTVTQVTITYDANGGAGTVSPQTIDSGTSVVLASGGTLTRAGYTFNCWNTNASGTGTSYPAETSYSFTSSITLYAVWTAAGTVTRVTITYDANGGAGTVSPQTIDSGTSVVLASGGTLTRAGYTFNCWNTNASGTGTSYPAETSYSFTSDTTLYAVWTEVLPSNLSLAESLAWIKTNAAEGGDYTITLQNDESIAPHSLSYGDKNISITLKGDTEKRTISLDSTGSLFSVGSGVTLTLENNVTLQGRSDNTAGLVWVNSGGTLVMNGGSKVSGNTTTSYGGGVYVGGTFTMNGGKISDNTASSYGGGVYVDGGMFTMNAGEISGNTARYGGGVSNGGTFEMSDGEISGNTSSSNGGGVYVSSSGTFEMSGGEISNNTSSSGSYANGGGVYVDSSGTFEMSGGEVSGNTAYSGGGVYSSGTLVMNGGEVSGNSGGGVYVYNSGTFTMNGGEVSGNSTSYYGGGVNNNGTFEMSGGEISGNSVSYGGGGVSNSGTFEMSGGAISGNTAYAVSAYASANGGGVSNSGTFEMRGGEISGNTASTGGGVYNGGAFTKQGGTIYGANAISSLRNTANSGNGHAVYISSSPEKIRTTTAGVGVALDSAVSGADGGWESTWGSVQIALASDPVLNNASLLVNQSVVFNAETNYASWTWYWNGELISGESTSTYTLTPDKSRTPGVYELSVVVVSNAGETRSARCRVVVKAK